MTNTGTETIRTFHPHGPPLAAVFETSEERWELPVIGWATVDVDFGDSDKPETRIRPVVLFELKYVITVDDYIANEMAGDFANNIEAYKGLRPVLQGVVGAGETRS